jgi:phage terminase small subunit
MLANGCQSGLIGAILAPIEANRDGALMSTKKPAAIRRLEGNPGKRVIEECGIDALGEPFIPEHLPDDARGCIEVIKASMPSGVYSRLDSFLLAAFAMAWVIHKRAAHEIGNRDFAFTVPGSTGSQVPSPWIKILNQQATIMASLGDRLGLDPRSRAALKLPSARQQKSKFDGLIGRAGLSLPMSN